MKIFTRYIIKEFSKLFLLTLSAMTLLYLVVEVFERVDDLVEHNAEYGTIIRYFLLKTPAIIFQIIPFVTLIATVLTLNTLSRNRELIAAKALGISSALIAIPILLSASVISVFIFIMNETVLPQSNARLEEMKRIWVEGKSPEIVFRHNKVWLKGRDGIYNIKLINPEKRILKGLTFYKLNRNSRLLARIEAREVVWKDGRWRAPRAKVTRFGADHLTTQFELDKSLPLKERPEDLKSLNPSTNTINIRRLNSYINRLEEDGYNAYHYKVDLYNKFTIPFASIFMALLGIPFGLKRLKSGIASGITLSLCLGFSYWILQALSTSLGYGEMLPPLLASALPNISFAALGVYLLTDT